MARYTKAQKCKMLNEAVDLIHKANALMQKALGADDEVYYIHTQLENASDDIIDIITVLDDGAELA
jgi:hypothetical protein